MPRLGNRIPKYRLHRQSGQAVVTINGRDILLGRHGTKASEVEYDRIITEWLASGRSTSYGVPEHVTTIVELIVAYLEYAEEYYGGEKRSEYANMRHALRPLHDLYGRLPARDFDPLHLKAVREKFIALGWSRKHINASVQRIGRMFRWAVGEGLIPPEVPQALAMVPGLRRGHTTARETPKVRPVSEEMVEATLPHLSPVVRAMVELQQATGMRPGELVILRPCDVDRSGNVWEYKPNQHKTENREQDRMVYIGPIGQNILRPFLLRDAAAFCFSPAEAVAKQRDERNAARRTPANQGNVIGSNRKQFPKRRAGKRYTTQSYNYAVRRACDRAFPVPNGISGDPAAVAEWQRERRWSPNQLRHSLGTKARREFDIETAKALLGHASTNVTGIYAEVDRRRAIEAAKLIG